MSVHKFKFMDFFTFFFSSIENFKFMASWLDSHLQIQRKHVKNILNYSSNHLLFQSGFPEK